MAMSGASHSKPPQANMVFWLRNYLFAGGEQGFKEATWGDQGHLLENNL